MKNKEDSDSIVSDEESLQLDCRRLIPKFKREDYDTFFTESNTSVFGRILEIRSISTDCKFKPINQVSPISTCNATQKKIHCTLLDSYDCPNIELKLDHPKQQEQKAKKVHKELQSPANSVHSSHKSKRCCQNFQLIKEIDSPIQRKGKRQLSHAHKSNQVEASPLRITRFSTRQIYVTQLVNISQEPIPQKLSIVQMENNEKKIKHFHTQKIISQKKSLTPIKPKSILKSSSCSSESSIGRNSGKAKSHSKKSSFFKKVTFDQPQQKSKHQQLIIIQ